MASDRQFAFGLFRFDARTGQLWRDGSEVKLTPRAAAVLHLLAERARELVTKREMFDRVWGGMAVGDDALTSAIQELRARSATMRGSPATSKPGIGAAIASWFPPPRSSMSEAAALYC